MRSLRNDMKCNADITARDSFDQTADQYEIIRPNYPLELYHLIDTNLNSDLSDRILEIGMGSGQATEYLLKKGYRVTSIEPGVNFCRLATEKFKDYHRFELINDYFENCEIESNKFDMIVSATAFHWVSSEVAYSKTSQLLKQGGVLLAFWNSTPILDDDLVQTLKAIFDRFQAGLSHSMFAAPLEEQSISGLKEAKASGFYGHVTPINYMWNHSYNAHEFTRLLDTYANFQSLDQGVRDVVFAEIERVILDKYQGILKCQYMTFGYLAVK